MDVAEPTRTQQFDTKEHDNMSFGNPPGGGGPFGPPGSSGPFGAPPSGESGAFGAPPSQSGPFGSAPATQSGPFGAPADAAAPVAPSSAFGNAAIPATQSGPFGSAPAMGGAFGAPPAAGPFGGVPPSGDPNAAPAGPFGGGPAGGAFGAPSAGGAFGAPTGGAFGAVPTAPSAGRSMGIIASVIGVVLISSCAIGFGMWRSAQARREARLQALRDSLAASRASYNYGSNTYGSNSYGSNNYGSTPTPTPSFGVPAVPLFVSNTGNRSMSEISSVLLSRSAAFRACALSDPNARAQMAVRFMIGSNGNVLTAFAATGASSGSPMVDNCVNSQIRTMYFSRAPGFSIVVHPINLR